MDAILGTMGSMIWPFVIFNLVISGLTILGNVPVRRFVQSHPHMHSQSDLADYRALARSQMRKAVALIPALVLALAWALAIVMENGLTGLLVALAVSGLSFVIGQTIGKVEKQARDLPVDETLATEYARISKAWTGRLFPDF